MLTAAFILGFAGSFHCIAMCAPITLALSPGNGGSTRYYLGRMVYNVGRISIYALLGMALGAVKEVFGAMIFDIHRYQEALSISIGVGIAIFLLIPSGQRATILAMPLFARALGRLRGRMGGLLRTSHLGGQFSLGLLNGLLPCGFVYMGLAMAALSGTIAEAGASMLAFGLGTFPAMIGVAVVARLSGGNVRFTSSIRRMMPIGAALVSLLFILRGLALGIPYISPKLNAQPAGIEQGCHTVNTFPLKP